MRTLLFFLVLVPVFARAEAPRHEILGGTSTSVYLGEFDLRDHDPSFSVEAGYSYFTGLWNTQISLSGSTLIAEGPDFYSLMIGPTFNFSFAEVFELPSAFFIAPKAGIVAATYTDSRGRFSNEEFATSLALGKRFALAENISWNPNVTTFWLPNSEFDPDVSILLFSLSVFF